MFGVDARRRHGNQTTFLEEPAPVDDQIPNTPLSRIDDHAVERADLDSFLSANVEKLDKRRLEAAVLQKAEARVG